MVCIHETDLSSDLQQLHDTHFFLADFVHTSKLAIRFHINIVDYVVPKLAWYDRVIGPVIVIGDRTDRA